MTAQSTSSLVIPLQGRRWATLTTAVALLPAAVLLLCSVSSDLVAALGGDPLGIWQVLPAGPVVGDWVGAEVSSTAFLLVAMALLRRKQAGFWMALSILAGGVVVQGLALGHPAAAATAVLTGAVLVLTRDRYQAGTGRRQTLLAAGLLASAVVATAVGAVAIVNGVDAAATAVGAVGSLLDLATPSAVPGLAAIGLLLGIARLGYILASMLALDPRHDSRPVEVVAAARRTLRSVGSGSLFPYQLAPECTPWADAAGTAALAAAPVGRVAVALGDPAGDPGAALGLLDAWADECRRSDIVPVVYQASPAVASWLRRLGWLSVCVGREAIVDPTMFDLQSSRVANLRHTVTRSRKGGITTVWSPTGLAGLEPRVAAGLVRLDAEWRRRAGPRLGFTVGQFDPEDRTGTGVAVALDGAGDPVAFVVLRPTGSDGGWMLDVMRRARNSVPGALEASLVAAVQALGGAGVRRLSLGLAPLAGLNPASDNLAERLLARGAPLVKPAYNHEGLAFFKNKFGPEWESRYLVVPGPTTLAIAVTALLRLHLGGAWPKVVRALTAGLLPAR